MRYNIGAIQRESEERLSNDLAICERDGASEETICFICDSEHEILISDCRWAQYCVSLDLSIAHEGEGAIDKELENVGKTIDLAFLKEDEKWLLDIETDELRDAILKLTSGQKAFVQLLLDCDKKLDVAETMGISAAAVQLRVNRIRAHLERTLSPETLRALTRGRKHSRV